MSKALELAKKLKELAEKGVGGEAVNAKNKLQELMKKHGLTESQIEGEETADYYFKISNSYGWLFTQIVKYINFDIKIYKFDAKTIKDYGLSGNYLITCTAAESIEAQIMFEHYTALYKKEVDVFKNAFISANKLLATPKVAKKLSDLTPQELEEYKRREEMASAIKSEAHRKRLN